LFKTLVHERNIAFVCVAIRLPRSVNSDIVRRCPGSSSELELFVW
jgi:hypothetical protein